MRMISSLKCCSDCSHRTPPKRPPPHPCIQERALRKRQPHRDRRRTIILPDLGALPSPPPHRPPPKCPVSPQSPETTGPTNRVPSRRRHVHPTITCQLGPAIRPVRLPNPTRPKFPPHSTGGCRRPPCVPPPASQCFGQTAVTCPRLALFPCGRANPTHLPAATASLRSSRPPGAPILAGCFHRGCPPQPPQTLQPRAPPSAPRPRAPPHVPQGYHCPRS